MSSFIDANGRRWSLRCTWGAIRRARAAADVDLAMIESHLGDFYRGDPILVAAVYACLEDRQAKIEELENGIVGEAMEEALQALLEAVIAFFPKRRSELITLAAADVERQISQLTQSSTGPQAPQASTLTLTPSEN